MSNPQYPNRSQSNTSTSRQTSSSAAFESSNLEYQSSLQSNQGSSQTTPTMEIHRSYAPLPQPSYAQSYDPLSPIPLDGVYNEPSPSHGSQARQSVTGTMSHFQPGSAGLHQPGLPSQGLNYTTHLPTHQSQATHLAYANVNTLSLGAAPRQRSSIACTYCRRRKIRCMPEPSSGGRCKNCIRLKKQCEYIPVEKDPESGGLSTPSSAMSSPQQPFTTFPQGQNTLPVFLAGKGTQWSPGYGHSDPRDAAFPVSSMTPGIPSQGSFRPSDYVHELSRRLPGLPHETPPTANLGARGQHGSFESRSATIPYAGSDPQAPFVPSHYPHHQQQQPIVPSQPSSPGIPSYVPGHSQSYPSLPSITTATRAGHVAYDPASGTRTPVESQGGEVLASQQQHQYTNPPTRTQSSYSTSQQGSAISPSSSISRSATDSCMVEKLTQARR